MLIRQLVKDRFGQHYKIQTSKDTLVQVRVKPEQFHSDLQASRFIDNLIVPVGFWKGLYHTASLIERPARNDAEITARIAALFSSGKIKAYKIDIHSHTDHPPSKRTITDGKKDRHIFIPASALLVTKSNDVITFSSKAEAHKYLTELSPDKATLQTMALELKLPRPSKKDDHNELMEIVASGMASGEIVVFLDKHTTPPPTSNSDTGAEKTKEKHAGLGPEQETLVAENKCNCTIDKLSATCSHGRKNSAKGILQVVPTQTKTRMEEYELMGVKITLKEQYSGTDEIDCALTLSNNKGSGCFHITDESKQIVNASSSKVPIDGTNGKKLDKWPIDASPQITEIQGHGCDNAGETIKVESFPNQYYTVQGELTIFKEWEKNVNKQWEAWAKKFFDVSPVSLQPKLTGPTGSFSANWGWKEDDDWRSYYNVSANFGLSTILGVEIKIVVSMGTLAYTAAGLPPNIAKLAADHIADLRLSAGASCKASLLGEPQGKFYPDNTKEVSGKAEFSAEGGVALEILVRAGSDYIISAELSISGESKVTGADTLLLDKSGLSSQTKIMLSPFIGTAKVKIRYLYVRTKTKEQKWQPWKDFELYDSGKKQILP